MGGGGEGGEGVETKAWKNGCLVGMGGGMEGRVWADWLEGREVIFTLVASRFVLNNYIDFDFFFWDFFLLDFWEIFCDNYLFFFFFSSEGVEQTRCVWQMDGMIGNVLNEVCVYVVSMGVFVY